MSEINSTSSLDQVSPKVGEHPLLPGIALCLSGGGYRAMLFHVGVLLRLNQLGYLPKLNHISSVSGGSIAAGVLGLHWKHLRFNGSGVADNFGDEIIVPIRTMANTSIDVNSILEGALLPGSAGDWIAGKYRQHLFGDSTMQDLPDNPHFNFNATNVQSAVLWRCTKEFIWDYRVGKIPNPKLGLSFAVAASSAFPPVLSPLVLKFKESDYVPNTGDDLQKPEFMTNVVLSDGGVYDNMGLETAWKNYQTVLVSDAGAKIAPEPNPKHDWAHHGLRINDIIDNQVRSLRKRQLIESFTRGERSGTYWGIRTDIANYAVTPVLPCPHEQTLKLSEISTRLDAMESRTHEQLINWGYAVCDAAMRAHVDGSLLAATNFPYPSSNVG